MGVLTVDRKGERSPRDIAGRKGQIVLRVDPVALGVDHAAGVARGRFLDDIKRGVENVVPRAAEMGKDRFQHGVGRPKVGQPLAQRLLVVGVGGRLLVEKIRKIRGVLFLNLALDVRTVDGEHKCTVVPRILTENIAVRVAVDGIRRHIALLVLLGALIGA